MNHIQGNQCNPYTREPYLLKLGIIPLAYNILIGNNAYDCINNEYYQLNHHLKL